MPYIRGITEPLQQVIKRKYTNTVIKPHIKLRQLLVHPKDKNEQKKKCNIIYEISCRKTYMGETGRPFNLRRKAHQKEGENETVHKNSKR